MRKLTFAALLTLAFTLVFCRTTVHAQQPTASELNRMIEDLKRLDPDIEKLLPRWKVLEANEKIKLAQAFKLKGESVTEADSMIVVASFPKAVTGEQELLVIRVGAGSSINGTRQIKEELGEGFYDELLRRDYAHGNIEPEKPVTNVERTRIPNVMQPPKAKQFIALSAFRQIVQVGTTGVRLEHQLGNDEVGYHFWSSGQGRALINYPIIPQSNDALRSAGVLDVLTISLGGAYRLKFGEEGNNLGGLTARRLNGALGFKPVGHLEYRFPESINYGVAGHIEVAGKPTGFKQAGVNDPSIVRMPESEVVMRRLPNGTQVPTTVPIQAAYFMGNVAQLGAFYEDWFNDYEHFFRITAGVSYQDIQRAAIAVNDTLIDATKFNYGTGVKYLGVMHPTDFKDWLYVKAEYLNQSGFPFGLTAQLSNRNFMVTGFVPLFPTWLFLEVKFSSAVLRDNGAAPWEQKSFVMFSPIIRIQMGGDD